MSAAEHCVRIRATPDRARALDQYQEMLRAGRARAAVVIVECFDGHFEVLGQSLTAIETAAIILVAAEACGVAERMPGGGIVHAAGRA